MIILSSNCLLNYSGTPGDRGVVNGVAVGVAVVVAVGVVNVEAV